MKIKFKLSIMMSIIVVVVAAGISFLLLRQASSISRNLSIQGLTYLNDHQAELWKGREDGYIRVLNTLANIMGEYESVPPEDWRDQYDNMLMATLETELNMVK